MKILVLPVGHVRAPLDAPVEEYEKRAARYWRLEVFPVEAGAPGRAAARERVMTAEAERILARIPEGFTLVALTRDGKAVGSRDFATLLESEAVRSSPGVAFALGGAFGLSPRVLDRARHRWSLSALTLPHEMARLVLAEQLYRAGTILRGEPYHKGA